VKAVHCGNDVLREVAAAHPDTVKVIDLDAHLCKPDGTCRNTQDGITLRNDGTHFRDDGAPVITKWLLDQLGIPAQLD
jgi:lysophospholipase L1-like esterase